MSDLPENFNEAITDNQSVTEENSKDAFNLKKEVFEWIYTIFFALVIAFIIKGYVFDIVRVDGPSMETTLLNNDRLIITKLGYEPRQKDIVILDSTYKKREAYYETLKSEGQEFNWITEKINYFSLPDSLKKRYYVKRIIATQGQTIDIKDGKVYIDGKVLKEDYFKGQTTTRDASVKYPLTVEEGHVFVMGDNRPHSMDSRYSDLGQVPVEAILGKAQLRIWPLNSIGLTK